MKKLGMLVGGLFFLFCLTPALAAKRVMTVKMGGGEARVSTLIGKAQVTSADGISTRPLRWNDRLHGGDEVATEARSKLELLLPDSSRIRFGENTRFRILEVHSEAENSSAGVRVYVTLGKAWANVARIAGRRGAFELQSENAVAGVRGTIYRMNVENDQSALVKVYDGQVCVSGGGKSEKAAPAAIGPPSKISGPRPVPGPRKVSMEEWTVLVQAMHQISINADGTPGKPIDFKRDEDRDEWVDWNRARDEAKDSG